MTELQNTFLWKGCTLHKDADGLINWRKSVPDNFIVPNRSKTKETDITKLEDNDLLILLGGIRHLAYLRGFTKLDYQIPYCADDRCVVICTITWGPEPHEPLPVISATDPSSTAKDGSLSTEHLDSISYPVTVSAYEPFYVTSAIASASHTNTHGFGKNYLPEIAENRAFCRCVRNFLRINIVSSPELGGDTENETESNNRLLIDTLKRLMDKKKLTITQIKERLQLEGFESANEISDLQNVPKTQLRGLIDALKKYKPE